MRWHMKLCGLLLASAALTAGPAGIADPQTEGDQAAASQAEGAVRLRNIVKSKIKDPEILQTVRDWTHIQEGGAVLVEYTVHLLQDGDYKPLTEAELAGQRFQVGDQFLLTVQAQTTCYIYVINQGPTGTITCLLPDKEGQPPRLERGQKKVFPGGNDAFEFQEPAGDEKFFVVATAEPVADLDALASTVCQQDESLLTPQQKELKKKIVSEGVSVLKSLEQRQAALPSFVGELSQPNVEKFAAKTARTRGIKAPKQVVLREALPDGGTLGGTIDSEGPARYVAVLELKTGDKQ
jgi:hypothetical protein